MLTIVAEGTRHERLTLLMQERQGRKPGLAAEKIYGAPMEDEFSDEEENELDFLPAPDIATIAGQLIEECAEFSHLRTERIVYLWKKKGGTNQGKGVLGKCVKTSGLAGYFAEAPWVVWLAADLVNAYVMNRRQVEALTYHELLHASVELDDDGNTKPTVQAHDVEAFGLEISRYGQWTEGLKLAKKSFEQPPLFDTKTLG